MNQVLRSAVAAAMLIPLVAAGPLARAEGKKVITSPDAPAAIGPYSQAIKAGDTLYLSGQIPIDPKTNRLMADAGIEAQTALVLDNLKAVLAANGMTMAHVVQTTVLMKDLNDFTAMNAVYARYFKDAPPARATFEVARLPRDVKIEIAAVARE